MLTKTIYLQGLSCQGCVNTVTKALQCVAGIDQVKVDLASSIASFVAKDSVSAKEIVEAIRTTGKNLELEEEIFIIEGMTCSGCAEIVRKIIESHPLVLEADVALSAGMVRIKKIKGLDGDFSSLFKGTKYRLMLRQGSQENSSADGSPPLDLWLGIIAVIPLFILSMSHDFGFFLDFSASPQFPWILAGLATVVQFTTGLTYYRGAILAIKNRSSNMDVLVALGSSVAWGTSLATLLGLGVSKHLYFESGAVIIVLVRIGKWFEERVRWKARSDLKGLFELSVRNVQVIQDDSVVVTPLQAVRVGMRVRVAAGEKVPLDGEVISGVTTISEAMLTGESNPITKRVGDLVFGGTMNLSASIDYRVSKSSEEGLASEIIRQVIAAQSSRSRIGEFADKVSEKFVPGILVLAALTGLVWWLLGASREDYLARLTAVLVVACPCALGLATPMALMVGVSQAAKEGILIRTLKQMENLGRIKTLVFDKTGTLTEGTFVVSGHSSFTNAEKAIFSSLESHSTHPIAKALAAWSQNRLEVQNLKEIPGKGIEGVVDGTLYRAGSLRWASEFGLNADSLLAKSTIQESVGTVVLLFTEKQIVGFASLTDKLRDEAHQVIAILKRDGIEPIILSGDQKVVVEKVAKKLGIEKYFYEISPTEKLRIIKSLPSLLGMIGDGMNDAAALAAADAGIAVSSGSELAKDSAGIVLIGGGIEKVIRLIRISRHIVRVIHQNLWWAFGYNILLIPIATGMFSSLSFLPKMVKDLDPMVAGFAMAASSISVVLNSVRLKALLKTKSYGQGSI
jgi:Cu+-exporting ATPase